MKILWRIGRGARKYRLPLIAAVLAAAALAALSGCRKSAVLQTGKYITSDGLAWVILQDDNQFWFNRNVATDYDPAGDYFIEKGKLTLRVSDDEEYIFDIKGGKLIFKSGILAESLIKPGTTFALSD